MRIYGILFTIAVTTLSLRAQVAVEVRLDQDQFLAGESLPADARISNRSGQALEFGREKDWLTFQIESPDGFVVEKYGDDPAPGEFTLESAKVATRRVDLAPHFSTLRPGRYSIVATVRIKAWNTEIISPPRSFDIINGAKLWSQEFGVPIAPGSSNRVPEIRRYSLEQANHLRTQLRLYFRLTDATGAHVFKVQAIGPMVSFSNLEQQLDKNNHLHVLWRTGRQSCTYASFNPDGDMTARQTYDITDSHPRLKLDETGAIFVSGGLRRATPNDVTATSDKDPAQVENR